MRVIDISSTQDSFFIKSEGENVLITLKKSIFSKEGVLHKYIQGNARMGWLQTYSREFNEYVVLIGEEPNQVVIPFSNIVSIQQNNKILKNDEILVV